MALSKRLRFEILRRDGFQCRYCGLRSTEGNGLTVDHVTPVTLGGTDEPSNLVAACIDCNAGKTSSTPDASLVEQVNEDALRWSKAMRVALDQARAVAAGRVPDAGDDDDYRPPWFWFAIEWDADFEKPPPLDIDWKDSVARWLELGLDLEFDLLPLIGRVRRNDSIAHGEKWRYFCGSAWGRLRERQVDARRLIETKEVA